MRLDKSPSRPSSTAPLLRGLKNHLPFLFFTLALFLILHAVRIVMPGLSGDGAVYSSIAMNMAHGVGTLWQPSYTAAVFPQFYEHPPLMMGIESLFFSVLGDGFYVEKIASFFAALMTLWGVFLLLRQFLPAFEKKHSWILIITWLFIPLNFYIFQNNLIEGFLVAFTVFACVFISKAIFSQRSLYFIIAGFFISIAFFVNGLEAFQPFIFILILTLIKTFHSARMAIPGLPLESHPWRANSPYRNVLTSVFEILILFFSTTFFIFLTLLYTPARQNTFQYFREQVIATLSGARTGEYQGFHHLIGFVMVGNALLPLIIFTLLIIGTYRLQGKKTEKQYCQPALFFLSVGLLSLLPVMMSARQQIHYFYPAFPFFVLSSILFVWQPLTTWVNTINTRTTIYRLFLYLSGGLLLATLISPFFMAGKPVAYGALYHEVNQVATETQTNTIGFSPELWGEGNWIVVAYFYRYQKITLFPTENLPFVLMPKGTAFLPGYHPLNKDLPDFELWGK